ncbi:hypothetical protein DS031_16545 [Bacillus taeanensis]|uniref:Uncharacterized protein n=1 Tax=Bacillus taeanensis TaxID=273032 RepID=A0A366XRV8_9BACI|nr:hypothetical protein DS031_16545 [Bacillus taeanensis]
MERKIKILLLLNLSIIFTAFIIGLTNNSSEFSNFAFAVCGLGSFFSFTLFLLNSKRIEELNL